MTLCTLDKMLPRSQILQARHVSVPVCLKLVPPSPCIIIVSVLGLCGSRKGFLPALFLPTPLRSLHTICTPTRSNQYFAPLVCAARPRRLAPARRLGAAGEPSLKQCCPRQGNMRIGTLVARDCGEREFTIDLQEIDDSPTVVLILFV
eukprot:2252178-Pleurochrysis_carterae.AAC.2